MVVYKEDSETSCAPRNQYKATLHVDMPQGLYGCGEGHVWSIAKTALQNLNPHKALKFLRMGHKQP